MIFNHYCDCGFVITSKVIHMKTKLTLCRLYLLEDSLIIFLGTVNKKKKILAGSWFIVVLRMI